MGRKRKEMIGQDFGMWRVLKFSHKKGDRLYWICECQCEKKTERVVDGTNLRSGQSKSCWCVPIQKSRKTLTKHGLRFHPLYSVWKGMKSRCNRKIDIAFGLYGGRGIKVCPRWNDFENFYKDMSSSYLPGLTLERCDNDGDYSPDNCKWIEREEQQSNTRSNVWVEIGSERMTIAQDSRRFGIKDSTLRNRFYDGDRGDALIRPLYAKRRMV